MLSDLLAQGTKYERTLMGVRVSELRVAQNLNRYELACRSGIHPKQVELVETGVKDPAFSTVLKLAVGLQVKSLDELIGPMPLEALKASTTT